MMLLLQAPGPTYDSEIQPSLAKYMVTLGVPWVVGPNLIGNAGHVRPNKLSASPSTDLEEKGDFMLQIRCCP